MQIYQISLTYHHSCTFLTEKTIHSQNSVNPLTINQIIPPTLLYTSPYNSKRPMLIFASAFYHFVFPLISKSVVPSFRETGTVPVFRSKNLSRCSVHNDSFHSLIIPPNTLSILKNDPGSLLSISLSTLSISFTHCRILSISSSSISGLILS